MEKILLVDDDHYFNSMLSAFLERNQFEVSLAMSSRVAIDSFRKESFDLILVDYNLPDIDGLELIQILKQENKDIPIILITSYSDINTAVRSIKLGAYEFVNKPIVPDELLLTIRGALKVNQSKKSESKSDADKGNYVIGKSDASQKVWEHLHLVAPTKMTVLILGESGTGKEYAARLIHQKSKRADKPFVALDCGVLSKELAVSELFGHTKGSFTGATQDKKGSFEHAQGGTIFLDEVGNLPLDVQVQLLRAIQERKIHRLGSDQEIEIDVRIIAATNEQLKKAVEEGTFRSDLYHRLNEFEIQIPPLRDRKDDIDDYVNLFLTEACNELGKEAEGVDDEAYKLLKNYNWPGNLRELKNVIKRGVLLSQTNLISTEHLPQEFSEKPVERTSSAIENGETDLKAIQEQNEKELIVKLLRETKFNKSKTAKLLNIDRKTLYLKLEKYNLKD